MRGTESPMDFQRETKPPQWASTTLTTPSSDPITTALSSSTPKTPPSLAKFDFKPKDPIPEQAKKKRCYEEMNHPAFHFSSSSPTSSPDLESSLKALDMKDHSGQGYMDGSQRGRASRRNKGSHGRNYWYGSQEHHSYGRERRHPEGNEGSDFEVDDEDQFGQGNQSQAKNLFSKRKWHGISIEAVQRMIALLCQTLAFGLVTYVVVSCFIAVKRDIDLKATEHATDIMKEINECHRLYVENRCDPFERVPAMEEKCSMWEACMKRDPNAIGRSKITAETFAEILNRFVEPLSYKTLTFFGLIMGCVFLPNFYIPYPSTNRAATHPANIYMHERYHQSPSVIRRIR